MQYSYKDLYQTSQMDVVKEHIYRTIRLARLASDFTTLLSDLYEKFGKELQALSSSFQQKTVEELLGQPKDRSMFEKSQLLVCWEKLLQEIFTDGQGFEEVSSRLKSKYVPKLAGCVDYKMSQVEEICAFRKSLDTMSDSGAADLHKSRVELRQLSLSYEHYRDYYSASKRNDKEKAYQSCVNAHNDYVIQLTSYNKLQKEYHSKSVPQALQELETIQIESMMTVAESIQAVAVLSLDRSHGQVDRYDSIISSCKSVSPSLDISRYVKSLVPTPNNYHLNLHSFEPVLDHPQTPACLLKCRVIHEEFNEADMSHRKYTLAQRIKEFDSRIAQKELQLKGVANAEARVHSTDHPSKLYDLQLEACKRRNDLNMLTLKNSIYKCQMSSMSFTNKHNGTDVKETSDNAAKGGSDRPSAGNKSIKAMWKRFAFKATKTKAGDSSLPASSEHSTQHTSNESQPSNASTLDIAERREPAEPDPVYALLRCAAAIRKNSSIDDYSASSARNRQNTTNLDISNSSGSSSPIQVSILAENGRHTDDSMDYNAWHHKLSISPQAVRRNPSNSSGSPKPIPKRRSSLVTYSESGVAINSSSDTEGPFGGRRATSVRLKTKVKTHRAVTNAESNQCEQRILTKAHGIDSTRSDSPLSRRDQRYDGRPPQSPATTKARRSLAVDVPHSKNAKSILLGRTKSSSFDVEDRSRLQASSKFKSSSHNDTNVWHWPGEMGGNARRRHLLHENRGWSADVDEYTSQGGVNNKYVILYDFYKREAGDLPLRAGDRVHVTEKGTSGWWVAEHNGEMGYFPSRYALSLNQQQTVLQVIQPFHGKKNENDIHLLKDQVVLQCGPEDSHGRIMVETDNIQTGKIERFLCPVSHLTPI